MIQARHGVFETNSSSTHTLQILNAGDYKKLESGECLLSRWYDGVYTVEEAVKICVEEWNRWNQSNLKTVEEVMAMEYDDRMDFLDSERFETLDHYMDDEYLETFSERFTTPSGDEIVVFGKYGYDG